MAKPDIEALIFDLGGVIVPHDNEALYDRLAARCSAPGARAAIASEALHEQYSTGERSIASLHRRLSETLGYGAGWDVFVEDFCAHLGVDEAMLTLVGQLSGSNRVMLFSNTNQVHWEHLVARTGGRLGRLEAHLSHEIGAAKPDLEAFRLVAGRAGVDPGRALFIDDRTDNVEAARRAGYQAEPFTHQADLEALLRSRGVSWTT